MAKSKEQKRKEALERNIETYFDHLEFLFSCLPSGGYYVPGNKAVELAQIGLLCRLSKEYRIGFFGSKYPVDNFNSLSPEQILAELSDPKKINKYLELTALNKRFFTFGVITEKAKAMAKKHGFGFVYSGLNKTQQKLRESDVTFYTDLEMPITESTMKILKGRQENKEVGNYRVMTGQERRYQDFRSYQMAGVIDLKSSFEEFQALERALGKKPAE